MLALASQETTKPKGFIGHNWTIQSTYVDTNTALRSLGRRSFWETINPQHAVLFHVS